MLTPHFERVNMVLYLSSDEYEEFALPRKCLELRHVKLNNRDCLLIKVDVPVIGQTYGFGERDVHNLLLVARFKDSHLRKLKRFPIDVHVFIPADLDNPSAEKPWDKMLNVGWATLYDNELDAKMHKLP